MKLKTWRVKRDTVSNQWLLPDCPRELRLTVCTMLDWLEKHSEGVTGYSSFAELDKFLMLQWWQERDGLKDAVETGDMDRFAAWFIKQATFPDVLRRARSWLVTQELVDVPDAVKKAAKYKQGMFQRSFGHAEVESGEPVGDLWGGMN